jgi:diacylglycerol kinase family enzyme
VRGGDAELADAIASVPGARIALDATGGGDLARAVGIGGAPSAGTTELPFDVVDLDDGTLAVNAIVFGVAPGDLARRHRRSRVVVRVDDRTVFDGLATTVVIATGQFLGGADLVPRGHPADGRIEAQVYALDPGQRVAMRRRLATGTHVPHPGIVEAAGRSVTVVAARPWALQVDGRRTTARSELTATVRAHAWHLVL